jgi:hypothetical protein
MIQSSLVAASVVFLGLALIFLGECQFLAPYRYLIWAKYRYPVALFALTLFINLFTGFYLLGRKLFLNDSGRKLVHVEKELRTGISPSKELSQRLRE